MTGRVSFSPHDQSKLILALRDKGSWSGQRGGVRIRLELSPQTEIDGKRVHWRVFIRGAARKASSYKRGRAGTVHEALTQIEEAVHRA